jgi:hypothetical protein
MWRMARLAVRPTCKAHPSSTSSAASPTPAGYDDSRHRRCSSGPSLPSPHSPSNSYRTGRQAHCPGEFSAQPLHHSFPLTDSRSSGSRRKSEVVPPLHGQLPAVNQSNHRIVHRTRKARAGLQQGARS